MLVSYACSPRYASNPFANTDTAPSPAPQQPTSSSSSSTCWSDRWIPAFLTAQPQRDQQPQPTTPTPPKPTVVVDHDHNDNDSSSSSSSKTTFSFVLVGATLAGALIVTAKTRRNMHRLVASNSLARRNAHAWRRVALDLAKVNAVAASRVESLVDAVLAAEPRRFDAQATDELKEARSRLKAHTAALRNGTAGEFARSTAEARNGTASNAPSTSSHRQSEGSSRPARSSFSFGGGGGFGFPSTLDSRLASFGDEATSLFRTWRSAFEGPSVSATSIRSGFRRGSDGPQEAKRAQTDTATVSQQRSAEEKWRRAAGMTAGTPAQRPAAAGKTTAVDAATCRPVDKGEDWVGNVEQAIMQRRQQEEDVAEDVLPPAAQEEEPDFLLPVSELHIASRLHDIAEDIAADAAMQAQRDAAPQRVTGASDAAAKRNDAELYPTCHRHADIEHIIMAGWGEGWGDTPPPSQPASLDSAANKGETGGAATGKPSWQTDFCSSVKPDRPVSVRGQQFVGVEREDAPAWSSTVERESLHAARQEQEQEQRDDLIDSALYDEVAQVIPEEPKRSVRAWQPDADEEGADEVPPPPQPQPQPSSKSGVGAAVYWPPPSASAGEGNASSPWGHGPPSTPTSPHLVPPRIETGPSKSQSEDATTALQQQHLHLHLASLREENKHIKVKLMELETSLHAARMEACTFQRHQRQGEVDERVRQAEQRLVEVKDRLGRVGVWAQEISRRLGLDDPHLF